MLTGMCIAWIDQNEFGGFHVGLCIGATGFCWDWKQHATREAAQRRAIEIWELWTRGE